MQKIPKKGNGYPLLNVNMLMSQRQTNLRLTHYSYCLCSTSPSIPQLLSTYAAFCLRDWLSCIHLLHYTTNGVFFFLHSIFLKWWTVNVFHFAAFFPLKSAIIWHLTFGKTPSITPYMQESRQHRFAMSKYWVLAISMSNFIMLRAFLLSILIILLFRLIMWDLLDGYFFIKKMFSLESNDLVYCA